MRPPASIGQKKGERKTIPAPEAEEYRSQEKSEQKALKKIKGDRIGSKTSVLAHNSASNMAADN